jgi:hypothetical protein
MGEFNHEAGLTLSIRRYGSIKASIHKKNKKQNEPLLKARGRVVDASVRRAEG